MPPQSEADQIVSDEHFEAGQRVRLKYDPGRVGVVSGKRREYGAVRRWQIVFPEGTHYVPGDQLEQLKEGGDDPLDLLQRGRFGHELDLRRTLCRYPDYADVGADAAVESGVWAEIIGIIVA